MKPSPPTDTEPTLTLYMRPACGYCSWVVEEAEELAIELQLVNIWETPAAREKLLSARGRATVPVLGIPTADGERLLPESRDIIAYLRQLVSNP